MKCPCKRNCPRRSMTCRVECPEYADYAACKMAEYERNAKRSAEKDVSPAQREKVPQWISVKDADRRAPVGQRVRATDGVFVGEAYRTSADSWRRYDDYRLWHDATGHTVTHWMPLPEEGEA